MIPTPPAADEIARDTREREERAASDRKMVWWTAVLAGATIILVAFTGINLLMLRGQGKELQEQRGIMREQAEHLRDQASQLKESVVQAGTNAAHQLRAYVAVKGGKILLEERPDGWWLEWHPEMTNVGQTPAHDLQVDTRAGLRPDPLPPGTDLMDELKSSGQHGRRVATGTSRGTLGAGQTVWQYCHINRSLSNDELKELRDRWSKKAFYIWGLVTYRDIFQVIHRTEFCMLADWDTKGNPLARSCAQHNDSD